MSWYFNYFNRCYQYMIIKAHFWQAHNLNLMSAIDNQHITEIYTELQEFKLWIKELHNLHMWKRLKLNCCDLQSEPAMKKKKISCSSHVTMTDASPLWSLNEIWRFCCKMLCFYSIIEAELWFKQLFFLKKLFTPASSN